VLAPKLLPASLFAEAKRIALSSPKPLVKRTATPIRSATPGLIPKAEMGRTTEYSTADLNNALVSLRGRYRPTLILSRARQHKDYQALATLYELDKNWISFVIARLDFIATYSSTNYESVLGLLDSLEKRLFSSEDFNDKENVLYAVLDFWKRRQFPAEPLEKYFRSKIEFFAPTLGSIMSSMKWKHLCL
jgi:hypothetical protein